MLQEKDEQQWVRGDRERDFTEKGVAEADDCCDMLWS